MKELVFKGENEQILTNSLLVAEKFEKRHSDVIRTIENQLEVNAKLRLHCILGDYEDEQGKIRPLYILDRDGFIFITMGIRI